MAQNYIENSGLNKEQAEKAWKMIYRLMDNVKTKMDYDLELNKGSIEDKNVYEIKDYLRNGMNGIIRNVLGIESN